MIFLYILSIFKEVLENILNKYNSNINGLIHVGANTGQDVPKYLKLENIEIFLFEPQIEAFRKLSKFNSYPNVYLFNYGLGNENKKVSLHKADIKSGVSSSILKPKLHLEIFPEYKFDEVEIIEIKKFSTIENIAANFLVLDVQGYELEVLKGFDKKINEIDYIFSEVSLIELYEGNTLIKDLDKFLFEKNFIRVKTFLYSNIPHGDAFYIRTNKLNKALIFYYKIKATIKVSKIYYYFNFLKDYKKLFFVLKKKIKSFLNTLSVRD